MHLLIAAAGSGSRMGATCNKLLLQVAGRKILAWTIEAVLNSNSVKWIGIIGQPYDKLEILDLASEFTHQINWINGGETRQESVQRGLAALPANAEHVLIHDGARCLVEPELIDRCSTIVASGQAVIAANEVSDTIKVVDGAGFIKSTPDRSTLWSAQTPQGFAVDQLREGHEIALKESWHVTDDASLYERLKWPVRIIESSPSNIKVTTPFDLIVAESVLASRCKN